MLQLEYCLRIWPHYGVDKDLHTERARTNFVLRSTNLNLVIVAAQGLQLQGFNITEEPKSFASKCIRAPNFALNALTIIHRQYHFFNFLTFIVIKQILTF